MLSAPEVLAQVEQTAEVATVAGFGEADLMTIIGQVINAFLGLLGVIFLILFIYSGFVWMTAGGDDKKVEQAKRILIQATIGLVITLCAYGITTFVINAITGGEGGNGGAGGGTNGGVSVESLSGALGSGPVRDHYPSRNQLDVPRNTRLSVTFKNAIDPTTVTDQTVKIFPAAAGVTGALTGTVISHTEDNKTFVFKPATYLGSATDKVQYKVHLYSDIKDAGGAKIFASSAREYEWSFTTGTVLDLTPPTVTMSMPGNAGTYARNIVVQANFSEPIDPSSATGTAAADDFTNITVTGAAHGLVSGEYQISNSYTSVSFVSDNPCGTNSCGVEIFCLPGNDSLEVAVKGATTTIDLPQADAFPYDGVVDMSGNSLDGNHDGTAGDSYAWGFSTTGDLALNGPSIQSISPNIAEEDVPLDQVVTFIFDGVLMSSTVSSETVILSNEEVSTGSAHEMWFTTSTSYLTSDDELVTSSGQVPAKTAVDVKHGTFLESVDGLTYQYGASVTSGVMNEYQNCYVPGMGPNGAGGACAVSAETPYCCNGSASATACALF